MEFSELILKRRSIRAFKEKDVDEKIIKKIMNEINQAHSVRICNHSVFIL